jgi:hypothetical protein
LQFYNFGEKDVVFQQNGITYGTALLAKQPPPDTVQQVVSKNASLEISFSYFGQTANTTYNSQLAYACDAFNVTSGKFSLIINFAVAAQSAGKVSLEYNNLSILNNGNVALSSYPKDVSNKLTLLVRNVGTNVLVIEFRIFQRRHYCC